jgi:hypothetical protein
MFSQHVAFPGRLPPALNQHVNHLFLVAEKPSKTHASGAPEFLPVE